MSAISLSSGLCLIFAFVVWYTVFNGFIIMNEDLKTKLDTEAFHMTRCDEWGRLI